MFSPPLSRFLSETLILFVDLLDFPGEQTVPYPDILCLVAQVKLEMGFFPCLVTRMVSGEAGQLLNPSSSMM